MLQCSSLVPVFSVVTDLSISWGLGFWLFWVSLSGLILSLVLIQSSCKTSLAAFETNLTGCSTVSSPSCPYSVTTKHPHFTCVVLYTNVRKDIILRLTQIQFELDAEATWVWSWLWLNLGDLDFCPFSHPSNVVCNEHYSLMGPQVCLYFYFNTQDPRAEETTDPEVLGSICYCYSTVKRKSHRWWNTWLLRWAWQPRSVPWRGCTRPLLCPQWIHLQPM